MKKIIAIAVTTLLFSCSTEKDPKPIKPTLEGQWEFTSTNLSGSFVIEKVSGEMKVVSGTFKIKNYPDYNIYQDEIVGDYLNLTSAFDKKISFQQLAINEEQTEITSTKQVYNTEFDPVTIQYESIKMTKPP